MRLIHWSFLPLILALVVPPTTPDNPTPEPSPPPEIPPPNTIIDFLSADVEYLYFLRHIQRLGLVPKINRMQNVTLFAPINLAFVDLELFEDDTAESALRYFAGEKFRVGAVDRMVVVLDSMYVVKNGESVKGRQSLAEKRENAEIDDSGIEDADGAEVVSDKETLGSNEKDQEEYFDAEDIFFDEDDEFVWAEDGDFDIEDHVQDPVPETTSSSDLEITFKDPKKAAPLSPKYFPLLISHQKNVHDGQNLRINSVAEIVEADNYVKHQRSYVHAIDRLLPTKPSMCGLLMSENIELIENDSITFISEMFRLLFLLKHPVKPEQQKIPDDPFPHTCDGFLANASTLLLPTDAYINSSLLEIERKYYTAILHGLNNPELYPTREAVYEMKKDALALLLKILLPDQVLEYSTRRNHSYTSLDSLLTYSISGNSSTGQISINKKLKSIAGLSSLAVADGLIHVFDAPGNLSSSQNPSDFFSALNIERAVMVPRKALYAMHFSQLVSEINFRKLAKFIGHKAVNQTILIDMSDRDDVKEDDDIDVKGDFGILSFTNRQQLLYRFLDSFVDMGAEVSLEKPSYHKILDSKLCLKKRIGSCYKVKVWGEMNKNKQVTASFNDEFEAGKPVLAANNNAIYFSNNDFEAPVSFKKVMAKLISDGRIGRHHEHYSVNKDACLQTLKFLDSFNLILLDDNHHGYTAFLPCGELATNERADNAIRENTWDHLGLVLRYLQSHPDKFKKVLEGMFLQDLVYTHPEKMKHPIDREIKLLSGDKIHVKQSFSDANKKVHFQLNNTQLTMAMNSDVLFNQGIIHITDQLMLPSNFRITLKELIETTEELDFPETSFFKLLEQFPTVEDKLNLDQDKAAYSLFVPTPDLLHWKNITANYRRLDQLLQMHMIPNSELQPLLDCISDLAPHAQVANYTFRTNRTNALFRCQINPSSGKAYLTFQKPQNSGSSVSKAQRVTILSHGCTEGTKNGSCVFLIDNPLSPSWFDVPDNFLYVHIGWISVGIGIIIGVILFGFCTTTLVLCLSTTGKDRKQTSLAPSQSSLRAPTESSYMRITSDEDVDQNNYDYGYETDNDMMADEEQGLLPKRKKKSRKGAYGSFSPMGTPSAPLMIDRENLKKAFNRDRNLPSLQI